MTTQQVNVQSGRVTTEGDELYYEVRGKGQPLLMIAPGGGDGWQYSFVADILADECGRAYEHAAPTHAVQHARALVLGLQVRGRFTRLG